MVPLVHGTAVALTNDVGGLRFDPLETWDKQNLEPIPFPDKYCRRMSKSSNINVAGRVYLLILAPFAAFALVWALSGIDLAKMDVYLPLLAFLSIFLSSRLKIELPRSQIHLTATDTLVFLALIMYGGEVAVLLCGIETLFGALNLKREGVAISPTTIVANVMIGMLSIFSTIMAVGLLFGPIQIIGPGTSIAVSASMLFTLAMIQFIVHSGLIAGFIAAKDQGKFWTSWNDHCLNALVIYLSGAFAAGFFAKLVNEINVVLLGVVSLTVIVVYITYRRYVSDIKNSAAIAENAERVRAEQAEQHVTELEHYVKELERVAEELVESREEFRHAAFHDDLTGLPNRNSFLSRISDLLSDQRRRSGFAVMFLDLNGFKKVNDSLGHSLGDELIVNSAKRLSNLATDNVLVGRFGGDEFAVLITDVKSTETATELATRIAHKIAEPFNLGGRRVFSSVSIGIAFSDARYTLSSELLRDADIAMYHAKENKLPYAVFDPRMHAKAIKLLELETDLRSAVERDEFEVHYQPIVNLDDASLEGFEALVRWNHPRLGLIMPNDFIPVAESTGMIIPMTRRVLYGACGQIAEWQRTIPGNEHLMVSVNLSVQHFNDSKMVEDIAAILRSTGLAPSCLKLEITESEVMENAEEAIRMLQEIRELGVRISIDDFGTGYSSLSYLHRLPIDTLKIDRSFVSTMENGTENGEIVRTIIALARSLKLSVVAEGIESIHQFHQLRTLGCGFGQGYLFSRPVTEEDARQLVCDSRRWRDVIPQELYGMVAKNLEYSSYDLPN